MIKSILFAAVLLCGSIPGLAAAAVPDAIWRDPPIDHAHPAAVESLSFQSRGFTINGQMLLAAGVGNHPTAIYLHGLPGYDAGFDLERTLQRAGWNVISFHYRGCWGSGGSFAMTAGVEDADALLAYLRGPGKAAGAGIDLGRIVLIGHSYGGYVASAVMAAHPEIRAAVLMAPWDMAEDRRRLALALPKDLQAAEADWAGVENSVHGVTPQGLVRAMRDPAGKSDLAQFAPRLANRPLLVLTATRDDPDDQARALLPALHAAKASQIEEIVMETDHGFNDHRIALQTAILDWLAPLTDGAER